jgi:type IV secretory pathway TrbL component
VWHRGADGNNMFALTFGQQEIPPMAQKMSKKQQRLNYKHTVAASRDMVIWP